MPGGKGPEQVGAQQTTSVDPRAALQGKFLQDVWQGAQTAYQNNPVEPYGGTTYAPPDPRQQQGLESLGNIGRAGTEQLYPSMWNVFNTGVTGGYNVGNSPAYAGLTGLGSGSAADQAAARAAAAQEQVYGGTAANTGAGSNAALTDLAGTAQDTGQYYGNQLQGAGAGALQSGQGYGNLLTGTGYQAGGAGQNYANMLTSQAGQIPGYTDQARNQLGFNAATANWLNPATSGLAQTAAGNYVNANPYINQMFGNAADAVTRAYQTATSPRTTSAIEGAGRYGSGIFANANKQNELNLGQTLDSLAGQTYGQNYAQERANQLAAQGTLGSQYLTGLGQSTQAAQAGGGLGTDTARLQQAGLSAAATQALQGLQQQAAAQGAGATATGQGYGQNITALGSGATAANQGLATGSNALSAGGQLGLSGLQQAINASQGAGTLGINNAITQGGALNTLQQGFQQGNQQQLAAAGMAPSLLNLGITGANTTQQAGAGMQTLAQQQITDQINRYNALQTAPWANLQRYSSLVGQPTGDDVTKTAPIYGSTPGQILGGIGSAANTLFGSSSGGLLGQAGGLTGGLSGLLGGGAPGAVLSGIGSGALPAVIAPEIGAAGLGSLAALNTGASFAPALAAAAAPAAWIICTELTRQGKMPKKHWAAGMPVFAAYPERTKAGYYCWAIPTVRHLRRRPHSCYSRFIGAIACWRAENIAAKRGVKGARRLWRGTLVSAIGYPICATLGYVVSPQDWSAVYREEKA